MLFKVNSYIEKLAKKSKAIKKEFYPSKKERESSEKSFLDPLLEDKFTPVKGLVHKYPRRVLILLTANCAAFCRFCTRRRKKEDLINNELKREDIDRITKYLKSKPKINEVILSGGDPLMVPNLLIYALNKFYNLPQIKIIRIHTRIPVSNPQSLSKKILDAFSKIKKKPLYLSIHFEHPDELTSETIKAIEKLKKTGAILLSQSVFLKGINDSYRVLEKLFTKLAELGVRPYYIYHCDLVKGIEHFIVPIKKEIEIMTKLRENLSGIAFPTHIVDTPNGAGKVPIPQNFWKFNKEFFKDFDNKKIKIY